MLRQHCQGGFEIPGRSGHDINGFSRSRPDVPCSMPDYFRAELPEVQPQAGCWDTNMYRSGGTFPTQNGVYKCGCRVL